MGDIENASLPSESYYTSDGSTESVTFPRVGDGVLGKRKIVVRCNHPTSLPKIDHVIRLEQSTDPVTSSSGSFDPATSRSCSSGLGTFGEALAEFGRSELAQALEEEVRNEYLTMCKRMMYLPHESEAARYNTLEAILLMVEVFRQMRTIDIRKGELTSIKYNLQLLEFCGFDCKYFNIAFDKMSSAQESFKKYEEEEGELRARMAKVQESCKVLDVCIRRYQGTL